MCSSSPPSACLVGTKHLKHRSCFNTKYITGDMYLMLFFEPLLSITRAHDVQLAHIPAVLHFVCNAAWSYVYNFHDAEDQFCVNNAFSLPQKSGKCSDHRDDDLSFLFQLQALPCPVRLVIAASDSKELTDQANHLTDPSNSLRLAAC